MKIGVVGNGFVGKATSIFGDTKNIERFIYDIDPNKCDPVGTTLAEISRQCDLIFVCVPSPMNPATGKCDTSIVENVVRKIQSFNSDADIVVRSTLPPGTCNRLDVAHMPEYLTEANWHEDFKNADEWHLGISPSIEAHGGLALQFQSLLILCEADGIIKSNLLIIQDSKVTEAAKYFRNAMLSVKISVCNEFKSYCDAIDIDYNNVRELFTKDSRIGGGHTKVPGPDGKRGFGGTCLVKDLSGLINCMSQADSPSIILKAVQERNNTVDRPEQEWLKDVGRSVNTLQDK